MNASLMHAIIAVAARLSELAPRPSSQELGAIAVELMHKHSLTSSEGLALLQAAELLAAPVEDGSDLESSAYESIECVRPGSIAHAQRLDRIARELREVLRILHAPARGSSRDFPGLSRARKPPSSAKRLVNSFVMAKPTLERTPDPCTSVPDSPEVYFRPSGTSPGVSINGDGPATADHACRIPTRTPRSSPAGVTSSPPKGSRAWQNSKKRTNHD